MPDGMYHWLAVVCRNLREGSNVKLATVAAAADKDQSGIYRFETGLSSPRDIEVVVKAYAQSCGVKEPQLLWADALHYWVRASENGLDALDMRRQIIRVVRDKDNAEHLVTDNAEIHDRLDALERTAGDSTERLDRIERLLERIDKRTQEAGQRQRYAGG